ncbi:MAG: hypothetical protein ACKOWF_04095, partial [Chloroflexota bacterium]
DKQCCTGICNKMAGKKNLDGKGRCRCVRKNGKCSEDRNCCTRKGQQLSCVNGTCGGSSSPLIPTSEACVEGGTPCEDANASCTTYDAGSGGPAGSYCLLPILKTVCTKAADCTVNSCYNETCLTCGCAGCPEATLCASPTVASGGSVQAAITAASDGDTITIAPGTSVEDLVYSNKNLTLLGCPSGGNEVILINATPDTRTIDVTDESDLTINDIVIQGDNDIPNTIGGGGIATAGGDVCIGMRSRIEGCAIFGSSSNGGGIFRGQNAAQDGFLKITDAVVIDGNTSDSYGGGACADSYSTFTIDQHVKITNNTANKGAGVAAYYAVLTVTGNVEITDNTAFEAGGGVHVYGGGHGGNTPPTVIMRLGGKTLITRNKATGEPNGAWGGGVTVEYPSNDEALIIEDDVVIDANSADSYGGGLYAQDVFATIQGNVQITGNSVTGGGNSNGNGGGVYHKAGASTSLTIQGNADISGNSVKKNGGGVWFNKGTFVLADNAVIKNNTADSYGGGFFSDTYSPLTATISGAAAITANTARKTSPSGGGFYVNSSSYNGGSITGCGAITANSPDQVANSAGVITSC